jgi:hypothetical protein
MKAGMWDGSEIIDSFEIGPFRCQVEQLVTGLIHLDMYLNGDDVFTGNSYPEDTPLSLIKQDAGVYALEMFRAWWNEAQKFLTSQHTKV